MLPSVRSDPQELHRWCRTSQSPGLGSGIPTWGFSTLRWRNADFHVWTEPIEPGASPAPQSCCFHGGSCESRFFLLKKGRAWDKAHVLQTGGSSLPNPGRNAPVLINLCRKWAPLAAPTQMNFLETNCRYVFAESQGLLMCARWLLTLLRPRMEMEMGCYWSQEVLLPGKRERGVKSWAQRSFMDFWSPPVGGRELPRLSLCLINSILSDQGAGRNTQGRPSRGDPQQLPCEAKLIVLPSLHPV